MVLPLAMSSSLSPHAADPSRRDSKQRSVRPSRCLPTRQPASTGGSRLQRHPTRNQIVRRTTQFRVSQATVDGARRRDPLPPHSGFSWRTTSGRSIRVLFEGGCRLSGTLSELRFHGWACLLDSNSPSIGFQFEGGSVQRRGRGQQRPQPFGALSKRRVPNVLFRSWIGPLRYNRKVRRDLHPQRPGSPG